MRNPAVWLISLPIRFYRRFISPCKRPSCRFTPTCSAYALEALSEWGAIRGSFLALRRVLRCNPFGGFGYDPVPVNARKREREARKLSGKNLDDQDIPENSNDSSD